MIQKNRSILIFVLLAFSLQSAQANTSLFQSFTDSVFSWFQEKTPIPAIFVASAIGFAVLYLFSGSKKKAEQEHQTQPKNQTIELQAVQPQAEYDIEKIEVMNQGSNLQCGYQTFKNSSLFYQLHCQQEKEKNLKIDLTLFNDKSYYNNRYDEWKKFIVKERKKQALKPYLQEQLKSYLNNCGDLFNNYKDILDNIAVGICEDHIENNLNALETIKYSDKQIRQLLHDLLENKEKKTALQNNLGAYIPDKLKLKIKPDKVNNLFSQKYINPDENLEGDEIQALLKKECNQADIRKHFTIVDDPQQIEWLENADNAKANWQNKNTKNYIHLFAVGTMSEKNKNKSGHWFMLAAQKLNGKKKFYTADSLGTNRANDCRVKEIIQYLED